MFDLAGGKPYYSIVILENIMGSMTEEAKEFSAKDVEWAKIRISEAICTNSFTISILAGAYLKLNKPIVNTNFFSKYENALVWTRKI